VSEYYDILIVFFCFFTNSFIYRHRGFCVTHNNYETHHILNWRNMFDNFSSCVYVVFGFEIAPETGTKHIQAYIYFSNPTSFKRIKKYLCTNPITGVSSGSPYFAPAKGNAHQNRDYCTKKDSADPDYQGKCLLCPLQTHGSVSGVQGRQPRQGRGDGVPTKEKEKKL
jgi:hypothetical protein